MKNPKEIKIKFLLGFLFVGKIFFCQTFTQKDLLKRDPVLIKVGTNYFPSSFAISKNINADYIYYNPVANEQINFINTKKSENFGVYFGIGKTKVKSKFFSIYLGATYLNYRRSFLYEKIFTFSSNSYPAVNKRTDIIAHGLIIQNIIGTELNFMLRFKNTKFILSPFNPSIIFSNFKVKTQEAKYYDVFLHKNYTDSVVNYTGTKTGTNYEIGRPNLPGRGLIPFQITADYHTYMASIALPVYVGIEQQIPLKMNSLVVGLKGTLFYGFQFYIGYSFDKKKKDNSLTPS